MQPCLARDGETLPDAATAAGAGAANPGEAATGICRGRMRRHCRRACSPQPSATRCATGPPWRAGSRWTTTGRSKRCGPSFWAGRTICLRAAKRRRTGPPSSVHSCRPASTCKSIRSCTCAMSSIVCPRIRSGWSWSLRHASGSASARILWHKPRPERLSFRAKALWRTDFRGHPIVVGVLWDLLRDLVVT